MKTRIIMLLAVVSLLSCKQDDQSAGLEYMPDMYQSPAVEYYGESHELPVDEAIKFNPSDDQIASGEEMYNIFCAVCHGEDGDGKGSVPATGKFPQPPAYADLLPGEVYNIIRNGKNAMPSYAYQLTEKESWNITAYVLDLQYN